MPLIVVGYSAVSTDEQAGRSRPLAAVVWPVPRGRNSPACGGHRARLQPAARGRHRTARARGQNPAPSHVGRGEWRRAKAQAEERSMWARRDSGPAPSFFPQIDLTVDARCWRSIVGGCASRRRLSPNPPFLRASQSGSTLDPLSRQLDRPDRSSRGCARCSERYRDSARACRSAGERRDRWRGAASGGERQRDGA